MNELGVDVNNLPRRNALFVCSNHFNISINRQGRRQTIKSGSAFKGQLYFKVGQMEGPKVLSETQYLV